jgi:hypothetical protein
MRSDRVLVPKITSEDVRLTYLVYEYRRDEQTLSIVCSLLVFRDI